MTTFYICRHGQTENNKNGRLSGWIDTPLTDEGIKNAGSSAAKLHGVHLDKIISSDLGRALHTAYIIARKTGFPGEIETSRGLREVNYGGHLANSPVGDYPQLTPEENADFVPEGGESLRQMQTRVLAAINGIAQANPGKTILLVAHDGPINAVRSSLSGENIGLTDAAGLNPHDLVAKFEFDEGKIASFDELQS
ncbi:MAG TPA: histidine phosphatase family protein [Bacillota bacterium]|nr:histidine phosphatase family protein [Bacillota bacterium]